MRSAISAFSRARSALSSPHRYCVLLAPQEGEHTSGMLCMPALEQGTADAQMFSFRCIWAYGLFGWCSGVSQMRLPDIASSSAFRRFCCWIHTISAALDVCRLSKSSVLTGFCSLFFSNSGFCILAIASATCYYLIVSKNDDVL